MEDYVKKLTFNLFAVSNLSVSLCVYFRGMGNYHHHLVDSESLLRHMVYAH
jgi:hypothetical protein